MKILVSVVIAVVLAAIAVQCAHPDSKLTESERRYLLHPRGYIPPEAAAGMAHMGELVRKQIDANRAAGVDSRGVPLALSSEAQERTKKMPDGRQPPEKDRLPNSK